MLDTYQVLSLLVLFGGFIIALLTYIDTHIKKVTKHIFNRDAKNILRISPVIIQFFQTPTCSILSITVLVFVCKVSPKDIRKLYKHIKKGKTSKKKKHKK